MTSAAQPLLEVDDLQTAFITPRGMVPAVDGISFTVGRGETLGIVGESGSGKTMACLSLLRLLPPASARITRGRILFEGEDLLAKTPAEMRAVRGARIAMILQDSLTSLNPAFTIGDQVGEAIALHRGLRGKALRAAVIEVLHRVRIPDAESHLGRLSACAERWHAPARGGCHRAVVRCGAADRRRADHRARRHRAGAVPRAAPLGAARVRHEHDLRHARPGRGRADVRSRCRDVCRPHRRDGADE